MKSFDGYLKLKLGNNYVLLAGGSHKALSDFSMSGHTHSNFVYNSVLDPNIPAMFGYYGNANNPSPYYANGDGGYLQVPTYLHSHMEYLYSAIMRWDTRGNVYMRNIANGVISNWKQFAFTSDLPGIVSKTANGLCPALPDETTTTKYLREDGTWQTPPDNNTWKPANTSLEGYAPKLTTGGGTIGTQSTEYVLTFKSGTDSAPVWKLLPTNAYLNTWTDFTGATASAAGTKGVIQAPAGAQSKFFRGDNTWLAINLNVTSALYVGASNGTGNSAQSTNGNVYLIFAEGSSYSRYKISGSGRASVTSDASGNITINSSGYSNFTTATASAAGSAGLVPAPGANILGTGGYFLRADGSWAIPTNTWKAANTSQEGYVPKLLLASTNTIATQSTEYVLTYISGTETAPVWRKLPANAFKNTWTAWVGATSENNGTAGYLGAPGTENVSKFLKGNGEWSDPYFAIEKLTDWATTTTTTASSIAFTKVWWKIAPTSSNQVYGIGIHPSNGLLYYIYNNKGTYTAVAYSANGNTWRNIYTNGTSRVETGTGTKAINFVQGNNATITYLAAGTSNGLSGSADYFNIKIDAVNTWNAMTGATSSANGTVGYVNATPPKDGYNTKFLRADGTWSVPAYPTKSSWNYDDRYVASVSISGNNLRVNKNRTNTDLTIPYANCSEYSNKVLGSYTSNGGQQNPNYFGKKRVGFLMMNTTVNGNSHYKDWMIMDCYSGNDVGGGVAIGVNRQALGAYIMRSAAERTSWAESAELCGTHNSSVSLSGSTLTVKIAGTSQSLTNTWRGILNNLTSDSTTDSLSAAQGKALASGSARDSTKLPLSGANYNTATDTNPFTISRTGGTKEAMLIMVNDSRTLFKYTNDDTVSSIVFQLVNTDTESGSGAAASDRNVTILSNNTGIFLSVGGTLVSLNGHKHTYTDLTGSGTTANLAILSNGTANGWTLKTLGSNAFNSTAYLPLSGGTLTGNLTIKGLSLSKLATSADYNTVADGIWNSGTDSETNQIANTPTNKSLILFKFTSLNGESDTRISYLVLDATGKAYIRGSRETNQPWKELLHSGNYTSYADSKYVCKAGDTMTGGLNFKFGHDLTQANNGVESDQYYGIRTYDKNNYLSAQLLNKVQTDGRNALNFNLRNRSGSTEYSKSLMIYLTKDGVISAYLDGAFTANSFIKSGGTSSQFLKADGSVDSNSYLLQNTAGGLADVNGNRENWWFKIATINITRAYINRPIVFEISQRGNEYSVVQIMFKSANNTDPELLSFKSNNTQVYYIRKVTTSTWEVYGKFSGTHGYASLHRITGCGANIGVTVNMTNAGTSEPSGLIQCSYFGQAAYAASAGYASSAGDADTVDGFHVYKSSYGPTWGILTPIKSDGGLEVGKYIDFHNTSNDGKDYATRIKVTLHSGNVIDIPTASGTLALTSQIPTVNNASLTLQTAGTTQTTFYANDSTNRTFNVTCANIGAAPAHDHPYVRTYAGVDVNPSSTLGYYAVMTTLSGITGDWWHILHMDWSGGANWRSELALPTQNRTGVYYRSDDANWAWNSWIGLLDTSSTALTKAGNLSAANFYITSDRNKKQNITVLSEHIKKFLLKDSGRYAYGVIAQEVPEMFRDGLEGSYTVNYNSVLSYYIGILENKVRLLEEKINKLEGNG